MKERHNTLINNMIIPFGKWSRPWAYVLMTRKGIKNANDKIILYNKVFWWKRVREAFECSALHFIICETCSQINWWFFNIRPNVLKIIKTIEIQITVIQIQDLPQFGLPKKNTQTQIGYDKIGLVHKKYVYTHTYNLYKQII